MRKKLHEMFFTIPVTTRLKSTMLAIFSLTLTERGRFFTLLRWLVFTRFENTHASRHFLLTELARLLDASPRRIRQHDAFIRGVAGPVMLHSIFKHSFPWSVTHDVCHNLLHYLRVLVLIGIGELLPGFLVFLIGEIGGEILCNRPIWLICWRNTWILILLFKYLVASCMRCLSAVMGKGNIALFSNFIASRVSFFLSLLKFLYVSSTHCLYGRKNR